MKKKILYVVYDFNQLGGIGRMLCAKIDAWNYYYNYDVVVVTANQANKETYYKPKFDFKLVDAGFSNLNFSHIFTQLKFCLFLNKVIKHENPDLVISSLTGIPSLLTPFFSKRKKTFLEIHGSGHFFVNSTWKYKWPFLAFYKGVVVLNKDETKYYRLNNLIIIPNFIEYNEQMNIESTISERKKIVMSAGRIHKDKQVDHLIKIWAKIWRKFPDWQLHLYGEGSKTISELEDFISENNIQNAFFKGATDDIDSKMSESSIFCLTSETEAFGMVILECKKNGLPVISYDSPNGPRNLITNDGILISQNNMDEFADSLEQLMLDEQLRYQFSVNGRQNLHLYGASKILSLWKKYIS